MGIKTRREYVAYTQARRVTQVSLPTLFWRLKSARNLQLWHFSSSSSCAPSSGRVLIIPHSLFGRNQCTQIGSVLFSNFFLLLFQMAFSKAQLTLRAAVIVFLIENRRWLHFVQPLWKFVHSGSVQWKGVGEVIKGSLFSLACIFQHLSSCLFFYCPLLLD